MDTSSSDFRSNLKKARGLGSAHHGVSHWWMQRLTAIALVPLTVWFLYALLTTILSPSVSKIGEWFASPIHSLAMVLMLTAMFAHAKLGLQVVIEDYVKCPVKKYALLIANSGFCILAGAISVLAVLKLHFLYVAVSL